METAKAENVPCRLSFEKIAAVSGSDTGAAVTQGVKLFIAPETEVKSGSKSISGKIITKMTKGTAVKMTGKSVNNDGYTWAEVIYNGKTCWCDKQWVNC